MYTKEDVFVTKQISGPIDHHSIFFPMVVYGVRDLFGYQHPLNYLPLCSAEQRDVNRFGTIPLRL